MRGTSKASLGTFLELPGPFQERSGISQKGSRAVPETFQDPPVHASSGTWLPKLVGGVFATIFEASDVVKTAMFTMHPPCVRDFTVRGLFASQKIKNAAGSE